MKMKIAAGMLFLLTFWLASPISGQSFDENCTVSAGGQTARVRSDGSYLIRNIPVGNGLLRVEASCFRDGVTLYGASIFKGLANGQTVEYGPVPLSPEPVPTVASVRAVSPGTLTDVGETGQFVVHAVLSHGSTADVTPQSSGSAYTSSNLGIVSVDTDGLVTAVGPGTASITVTNQGATSAANVTVSLGDPLTTVEGFAFDKDGQPAADVVVTILDVGGTDITDASGHYSVSGVATLPGDIRVYAEASEDDPILQSAISPPLPASPGGITDAGILVLGRPRGRIVLVNDEWGLANRGFSNCGQSSLQFITNVLSRFTQGALGDFLAYSSHSSLRESALRDAVEGLGHSWTVSTSVEFTFKALSDYEGVFFADPAPSNLFVLRAYLSAGGALYVQGGTSSSGAPGFAASWNPLLNRLGVGMGGSLNGIEGCIPISNNHPVLAWMTSYFHSNGQDVFDTLPDDPGGKVIAEWNGRGLFVVYDPSSK